ncbi:putative SNARE [Gregarina niphandrodes]|uniref:SNARE n=1 Tax=Gregarina niphandrodes TaxID=110365 RepID=A0A023AXE4_GRENI|nr:putative SNARE [Gregarina niphandrodes]EZG43292.1 putative SNARE [Gregarina niphandrodes]|eukprot:XP_011133450.1 putative SNARE [Gregarina niphandrodes]
MQPANSVAVWESRIKRTLADSRLLENEARQLLTASGHERSYLLDGAVRDRSPQEDVLREAEVLDESLSMVEQAILSGRESARRLHGQNRTLKSAHRRVRSALQSAGVSLGVINAVERRIGLDRALVAVGMFVTLLAIYLFFCWWKTLSPLWFVQLIHNKS